MICDAEALNEFQTFYFFAFIIFALLLPVDFVRIINCSGTPDLVEHSRRIHTLPGVEQTMIPFFNCQILSYDNAMWEE